MNSVSQKKNTFKVQIRKKRVQDKIAYLRSTYLQSNSREDEQEYSDNNIAKLIRQNITSRQSLISKVGLIKSASFQINDRNVSLFFCLIESLCHILGNVDGMFQLNKEMKQTVNIQNKDVLYNQILTILINISSSQAYTWPVGQYLPIIKNLLNKQRQINTIWFLSNILYQKPSQNTDTTKQLTRQLVKYDSISFCEQRIENKFQNQQDIVVFSCFVCSFLTNSCFLVLEEHKRIVRIIQKLSQLNLQSIDWFIIESMIDHAPHLAMSNYELLYSELIARFRDNYVKKKKTKMALKFLEFIRTYIFCEIQQSLSQGKNTNEQQVDKKQGKTNYERISVIVLPTLTICLENRSPQLRANLMEISTLLLQYYFGFVDLTTQQLYLSLAQGLKQDTKSILSKYSDKALYWQLRLTYTILKKIKQYKISGQLVTQFISQSKILEGLGVLLKDKSQQIQIVGQITQFLLLLLEDIQVTKLNTDNKQQNQYFLSNIKQTFQLIMHNHLINDQDLYNKIQVVVSLCQKKRI